MFCDPALKFLNRDPRLCGAVSLTQGHFACANRDGDNKTYRVDFRRPDIYHFESTRNVFNGSDHQCNHISLLVTPLDPIIPIAVGSEAAVFNPGVNGVGGETGGRGYARLS